MTTTINISLPKQMYEDAKKMLAARRYSSISELIRDALRKHIYEGLTVNGFTKEFEDEVLRVAAEPDDKDQIFETEKDISNYFRKLDKKVTKIEKSGKN